MSTLRTLQGKNVALTGRFSVRIKAFREELEQAGAKTTRNLSTRTDVMIVGSAPSAQMTHSAKHFGVELLTEEEARTLMHGDTLTRAPIGQTGETHLDALIGEARSILAQPMTPSGWEAIVQLIDACHPSSQHPLVNYLDTHLTSWDAPEVRNNALRKLTEQALSPSNANSPHREQLIQGIKALSQRPAQSLRRAPHHWIGEMIRGAESPKYRLVQGINLSLSSISQKQAHAMFVHPELSNLTELTLGTLPALTFANLNAILTHKNFANLRYFAPRRLHQNKIKRLHDTQTTLRIHTLKLEDYEDILAEAKRKNLNTLLAHAPCFKNLETLVLSSGKSLTQHFLNEVIAHDLIPSLHTIVWQALKPGHESLQQLAPMLINTKNLTIDCLHVTNQPAQSTLWQSYLDTTLPQEITTLDLASLAYCPSSTATGWLYLKTLVPLILAPDDIITTSIKTLCQSTLLTHIQTLHLGPMMYDERVLNTFATHRPNINLKP